MCQDASGRCCVAHPQTQPGFREGCPSSSLWGRIFGSAAIGVSSIVRSQWMVGEKSKREVDFRCASATPNSRHRGLRVEEVLARRLFPSRFVLSAWVERCYAGRIPTRRLARIRVHQAVYAA